MDRVSPTANQAADTNGLRKARYLGQPKVELEHYLGATAINITRLDASFTHQPLDRAYGSQLILFPAAAMNAATN